MREVTKDEFYKAIGPFDCHPDIVGRYPYTSLFRMQRSERGFQFREIIGRVEDGDTNTASRYFILPQLYNNHHHENAKVQL